MTTTTQSRPPRWFAWSGPLFTVGWVVFGLILGGSPPGDKASAARVMEWYNEHQGRTVVGALSAPLGAFLILMFAAYVRRIARDRGAPLIGPTLFVGGAIALGVALMAEASVKLGLEAASDHNQPQVAQTLNVLDNNTWIPFIGALALLLIGAGMTVLRSGILPAWLGWVAVVGGVISLFGPGGFVGFFLLPLWVLVAGIWLAVGSDRSAPAATGTPLPPG